MADTAKRLAGPTQPGTSNGTLYTVPASTTTIVRSIIACNTTASTAKISLAVNGSAVTAANCIWEEMEIPANGVADWSGFLVLAAAETLQALQGTTNAITITISGVEVT